MYIVKSCTEFNILTGIPPCSEYPLGDCAACRLQTNAVLTLKLGASDRCGHELSDAPSFMC